VHLAWREGATPYYELCSSPDDVLRESLETFAQRLPGMGSIGNAAIDYGIVPIGKLVALYIEWCHVSIPDLRCAAFAAITGPLGGGNPGLAPSRPAPPCSCGPLQLAGIPLEALGTREGKKQVISSCFALLAFAKDCVPALTWRRGRSSHEWDQQRLHGVFAQRGVLQPHQVVQKPGSLGVETTVLLLITTGAEPAS
jgi:hypothetical protein